MTPVEQWPAADPLRDGVAAVLVRPAREDELEAVGELTVTAYMADRLLTGDEGYVPVLADAARRAAHADLVVAVDPVTDQLLGTVTFCTSGTAYAEVARDGEAEFRMLAVSPDARRRGIGEALVRACVARARALGRDRIVLSTLPSMSAAHALYERLGFTRLPERDWGVQDVWLIAYAMSL
ncbi:MAG: GNAT family N-acetyltransferase [Actinomycetes bacterium]